MDLTGKRVAFTGTAQGYSRDTIYAAIRSAGGTVDEKSVSVKTDLLVLGEKHMTSSKLTSAQELGVPIVKPGDFMRDVARAMPWPYATPTSRKPPKVKPNKAAERVISNAIKQMSKSDALTGYVGF